MASTASSWRQRQSLLEHWRDRLTQVQLDNRDALTVIRYWDSKDTVFYLDPPYVLSTRVRQSVYTHEQPDSFHHELVDLLCSIKGQVLLSGYDSPVYEPLAQAGYTQVTINTACHAAGRIRGSGLQGKGAATNKVPRSEVIWRKAHETNNLFS